MQDTALEGGSDTSTGFDGFGRPTQWNSLSVSVSTTSVLIAFADRNISVGYLRELAV